MNTDRRTVKSNEGRGISTLWEGGAAGIDEQLRRSVGVRGMIFALQMGMAVEHSIIVARGEMLRVILMAVRQEIATGTLAAVRLNEGIGKDSVRSHKVEVEKHLIDLGITVTTDTEDAVGTSIETLYYAGSVEALGQTIARTIVKDVTEEDELVAALTVVEV